MIEQIHVVPESGGVWAVKDADGYLGFAPNEGLAVGMGRALVGWFASRGQAAELHIERSFAPVTRPRNEPVV